MSGKVSLRIPGLSVCVIVTEQTWCVCCNVHIGLCVCVFQNKNVLTEWRKQSPPDPRLTLAKTGKKKNDLTFLLYLLP